MLPKGEICMKRFLVIPDSFKGSISSSDVCRIAEAAIKEIMPDASVRKIPVADGGEGSTDAFLEALGGEKRYLTVRGPFFEDVGAFYGVLSDSETAVIEMASCAGLPLVGERLDVMNSTTFGVGELMRAAASGCGRIIMGLGGSATNDGGCGAAAALGVVFRDRAGRSFVPTGGTLCDICHIETGALLPELSHVKITAMCDVDNPLYGENGAAYVFAPQKGATAEMADRLDSGLRHLAEVAKEEIGADFAEMRGAGAAGGMGFGMKAFFGAEIRMGIDAVLDAVAFERIVSDVDAVITGEGRLDRQSLRGKTVIGVARRAKAKGVPVIAVVGAVGEGAEEAYDEGVSAIFSTNRVPGLTFEAIRPRAERDLFLTVCDIVRLIKRAKCT